MTHIKITLHVIYFYGIREGKIHEHEDPRIEKYMSMQCPRN
jgi:hypothetical protein